MRTSCSTYLDIEKKERVSPKGRGKNIKHGGQRHSQNRNVRRDRDLPESHVSKQGRLSDTVSTDETVSSSVSESESSVGAVSRRFHVVSERCKGRQRWKRTRRGRRDEQNPEGTEVDVDGGEMDILGLVLVSHVKRVDLEMKGSERGESARAREGKRRKEKEGGESSSPS